MWTTTGDGSEMILLCVLSHLHVIFFSTAFKKSHPQMAPMPVRVFVCCCVMLCCAVFILFLTQVPSRIHRGPLSIHRPCESRRPQTYVQSVNIPFTPKHSRHRRCFHAALATLRRSQNSLSVTFKLWLALGAETFARRSAGNTGDKRVCGGLLGVKLTSCLPLFSLCDFCLSLSGAPMSLLVIAAKTT